jgi:23S rRNA (uracil1939-C5)-methyltransferase
MSQEGRGIATRAGKVVFVSDALAGEQVLVQCTAVKRDYDEARMIELVADTPPAAQRVQPACPIYQTCGGCSLQHWSLAAQQQHKQANLQALLASVSQAIPQANLQPLSRSAPHNTQSRTTLEVEPSITGPASGFRHRLRLLVTRGGDNSYALALRQRGSHEAVNLQHCLVANSAVNAMISALPGMLHSVPDLQGLREIEIDADSDNRIGLCFYIAANPGEKQLSSLRTAVMTGAVVALRVRLNTQRKSQRESREDSYDHEADAAEQAPWQELLAEGELCYQADAQAGSGENVLPALTLAYQPGDFTQTHWAVNAALVARALDWLQPGGDEHALDLFAGIGNFSLPLARLAKSVHAFESDSSMTARVASNAERNGIDNVRASTLDLMTSELVLPKADIAIVDPPRAGAKAVCEALVRAKVRRIVYVSCHPATLVRDARILLSAGYRLQKAAAVDMFPHTGHSEAIVLFSRK